MTRLRSGQGTAYHRTTMPSEVQPASIEELAGCLEQLGSEQKIIETGGAFSKRAAGGELPAADVRLSMAKLNQVAAYEPADLTISVEAGLKYSDLTRILDENGQFLPLDPPFAGNATVGGVIAANSSGPRRRRYGTARDMVIGMEFVTMEGKRVRSGGMVVKNVTGLDMAKLMIGSLGTLACIAKVNFKVFPKPANERTFVFSSRELKPLLEVRRELLSGVLQPVAIDLLNREAVHDGGLELPEGHALIASVAGNAAAVQRYRREYEQTAWQRPEIEFLTPDETAAAALWKAVQELTPRLLADAPQCSVIRVPAVSARLGEVFQSAAQSDGARPVLARAGNGVGYVFCRTLGNAQAYLAQARREGLRAVVEYAPVGAKQGIEHWAGPGPELDVMRRIKQELDPHGLLNPGRLHNLI